MDLKRACELLSKAVATLATGAGEVRARLDAAREDLFELQSLTDPGIDDYITDLDRRIADVKQRLSGGGAMDLSEQEGVVLAKEILGLKYAVCGAARDV